jgi:hypothetical protein
MTKVRISDLYERIDETVASKLWIRGEDSIKFMVYLHSASSLRLTVQRDVEKRLRHIGYNWYHKIKRKTLLLVIVNSGILIFNSYYINIVKPLTMGISPFNSASW